MNAPPKIENAPGLKWKRRRSGWSARWCARDDLIERGFKPKSMALYFVKLDETIHPRGVALIQTQCNELQAEMLVWGRGGAPEVRGFDGTIEALMNAYMTDELSDFRECRYGTRKHYRSLCKVMMRTPWKTDDGIEQTVGITNVSEVKARHVKMWHRTWSHGLTRIPMGHACVGMLRTLLRFGVTILEDEQCIRLSTIMSQLSFPMGKSRETALSAEQVIAIRELAHKKGFPSIALAQAIQFEFTWRQKDVIGEWVPINEREPGHTDIFDGNNKWLRGLRWNEIDGNLKVHHITSKRLKMSEPDIRNAPMVQEELQRIFGSASRADLPASGPVIICETTSLPWVPHSFRLRWREFADELGIPKNVKNMDTRAGAITEAFDADAPMEKVRKTATHSNASMTSKYSRGDAEATADVMQIRASHRVNKPGRNAG